MLFFVRPFVQCNKHLTSLSISLRKRLSYIKTHLIILGISATFWGEKKCKFISTTSTSCYLYKCSHLYGCYFFHQCLFPLFWLFDIDSIVIRVYTVCERKSQEKKNKAAVSSITHLIDRRGVLFLTIVSLWLLLIGLFGVRSAAAMNRLLNELRGPFKCQVLHWYTHHFFPSSLCANILTPPFSYFDQFSMFQHIF